MLFSIQGTRPSRLAVLSYDISCPRRARRVRRVLDPLRIEKQYSVFETRLGKGEFNGVLAELSCICDFSCDRLAAWWPLDGLRLHWRQDRLMVDARMGEPCHEAAALPPNTGNFIVCYDISDPDALRAVAAQVAVGAVMVQRSVYWFRGSTVRLSALLARCAPHLAEGDKLWAYPLRGSHELWNVGAEVNSILPIATHHWRSS
jgi:CRISPR/Cas system-associated endoribonuclease Cas2